MNNKELYESLRIKVESRLSELLLQQDCLQSRLIESMRYSLMAGGKRIRPILAISFCTASGGSVEDALDFGCALEMLHTYSLIHDDMPCMDNDELRRGMPTNHLVYGEWLAMLSGDALQAEAFSAVVNSGLDAPKTVEALKALALAAGSRGICGGQYIDLAGEGKSFGEEEMYAMHSMKTAALIMASCEIGCVAAGAGAKQRNAARTYGEAIGLAFQIRDDILDIEGNARNLGKNTGSDEKSEKSTFVSLYGIEHCCELIYKNTQAAKDAVANNFSRADFLCWLADTLAGRMK